MNGSSMKFTGTVDRYTVLIIDVSDMLSGHFDSSMSNIKCESL